MKKKNRTVQITGFLLGLFLITTPHTLYPRKKSEIAAFMAGGRHISQ